MGEEIGEGKWSNVNQGLTSEDQGRRRSKMIEQHQQEDGGRAEEQDDKVPRGSDGAVWFCPGTPETGA